MATTELGQYRFFVKEGEPDTPLSLSLECDGPELKVLGYGWLHVNLKPGVSMEQARELQRLLNRSVASIGYTRPH